MKKRIITFIVCAVLVLCALPITSCTKEKMPESLIGQVDYIVRHRLETIGCKVSTKIDEQQGIIEVTVKKDKYQDITPFNAENYINIAGRPGKFSAFILTYERQYFEVFSDKEIDGLESKKIDGKDSLILKLNESVKVRYTDAAKTAIDIGEPIYILLDNEVIAAPMLEKIPETNTLTIMGGFDEARVRKIKAMVEYGKMPCLLEFGQSSFDSNGHLCFTLKLVEEPAAETEAETEAEVEAETETEVEAETEEE